MGDWVEFYLGLAHDPTIMINGMTKKQWQDLKYSIYRRDDFRCVYCGLGLSKKTATVDHVIPKSKGGTHDESNLVTACSPCNRKKADNLIEQNPLARMNSGI